MQKRQNEACGGDSGLLAMKAKSSETIGRTQIAGQEHAKPLCLPTTPVVRHTPWGLGGARVRAPPFQSGTGGNVTLSGIGAVTKEMIFHLSRQVLTCARVG